jgi:Mlc titration factor MtfA (ptsG expression regulator)
LVDVLKRFLNRCWNRLWRWRKQSLLRHHRIPFRLWERVVEDALAPYRLDHHDLHRLRELASQFLHDKVINGAGGLEVDDYMRTVIASQACLLILNLGLEFYEGWQEIIVYPDSFVVAREGRDDAGVVHQEQAVLGGESWGRGPVVLAWGDCRPGAHSHGAGSSVILHEFAHKLDMLNGAANGMPPLHGDMDRGAWSRIFTRANADLHQQIAHHRVTHIDAYGAVSPAEFFAVVSEEFFGKPAQLHTWYPDLYQQLSLFYRQDPLKRLSA